MVNPSYTIHNGNSLEVLKGFDENSIDSIVCDPPYELGFMNKKWDSSGIAYNVELWKECLRVLKPGGHLLAFSGSRTYHRMTVAIEDAGFEIRDQIMWVYGSGFPKSHDISKAIDKMADVQREVVSINYRGQKAGKRGGIMGKTVERIDKITVPTTEEAKEWDGWGTALKPAHEPICLARKPLIGTVAENILEWATGGLNIDGCRIEYTKDNPPIPQIANGKTEINSSKTMYDGQSFNKSKTKATIGGSLDGRFPANFIHDGSDEILSIFPETNAGAIPKGKLKVGSKNEIYGKYEERENNQRIVFDSGSAARFFYCAKASKKDRDEGLENFEERKSGGMIATLESSMLTGSGNVRNTMRSNHHPTVKPTSLMQYLCRLVTPPNGIILDPFMGSGSTGKAAMKEKFNFIGIDLDPEYCKIAEARIEFALNEGKDIQKTKQKKSDNKTSDIQNNKTMSLW